MFEVKVAWKKIPQLAERVCCIGQRLGNLAQVGLTEQDIWIEKKLQVFSQNKQLLMKFLQIIGMRRGNLVESLNSV